MIIFIDPLLGREFEAALLDECLLHAHPAQRVLPLERALVWRGEAVEGSGVVAAVRLRVRQAQLPFVGLRVRPRVIEVNQSFQPALSGLVMCGDSGGRRGRVVVVPVVQDLAVLDGVQQVGAGSRLWVI